MPPAKPQTDSKALTPEKQLVSAMQLLHEIVQTSGQKILVDPDARPSTRMVYTHGVTLWMLILQRLGVRDLKVTLDTENIRAKPVFPAETRG